MTEKTPERSGGKTQPQADHQKSTEQRIADLELQLASVRAATPTGTIPEHAGGPGTDIAPTWSQAEQEAEWADANAAGSF